MKIAGLFLALLFVSSACAQKVAHRIGANVHYPSYTYAHPVTPSPLNATSSTTQRIGIYTYTDYETPQGRVKATQQTIGGLTYVDYDTPRGRVSATYQTIGGITHGDYRYSSGYGNNERERFYDNIQRDSDLWHQRMREQNECWAEERDRDTERHFERIRAIYAESEEEIRAIHAESDRRWDAVFAGKPLPFAERPLP